MLNTEETLGSGPNHVVQNQVDHDWHACFLTPALVQLEACLIVSHLFCQVLVVACPSKIALIARREWFVCSSLELPQIVKWGMAGMVYSLVWQFSLELHRNHRNLEFISRSFQGGKVCGLLMPSQRSGITHWLTWQWKIMIVQFKDPPKNLGNVQQLNQASPPCLRTDRGFPSVSPTWRRQVDNLSTKIIQNLLQPKSTNLSLGYFSSFQSVSQHSVKFYETKTLRPQL